MHCEFSDDSREPMENQIEAAIRRGLEEICFTDHVDYGIKKDWSEGNIQYRNGDGISSGSEDGDPVANVDYPRYFAKLHEMQQKYRGRISIKEGLEFGIQTITVPQYEKLYLIAFDRMLEERRRRGKLDGSWHMGTTAEDVFHWWMEDDFIRGQMSLEEFLYVC